MLLDVRGSYLIGGGEGESLVQNVTVTNNIASGGVYAGFIAPGYPCGDTSEQVMKSGNLAHSIDGEGWVMYSTGSTDEQTCWQASGFTSYKTTGAGALGVVKTNKMIVNDMIIIDAGKGLTVNHGGIDGYALVSLFEDIDIYGEIEDSHDCPEPGYCGDFTWTLWEEEEEEADKEAEKARMKRMCFNKRGTITPLHLQMKKPPIATTNVMIPLENPDGDSSFAGHVTYKQVRFHNFSSGSTYCGYEQHAIELNPSGSDIIPLVDFIDNEFNNVDDSAFIYMFTPPDAWITVRECGSFPCTGPWNTVFSFSGTTYSGKAKIYK